MGQAGVVIRTAVLLFASAFGLACAPPPAAPPPQPVTPEAVPEPAPAAEQTPVPEPGDRRAFARYALSLYDAKRYEEAVPALTEAARNYPEVAPFLRLRLLEAEVERGNLQNAVAIATELVALSNTSAATVARLRLPPLYAALGNADGAQASWQQTNSIAIDELTESEFVAMADALAKAGRGDLATGTRLRLLTDYTGGRFTERTYDLVKNTIYEMPVAEQIAMAGRLARANRYDQALDLFNRIPGSATEARATRLRALFNSRNYTRLLDETKDVQLGEPSLVLLRARAAWRAGRPDEFLAGLAQVEREFASSKEASEAKVLRAKYYVTDVVDYARSIENLSQAIDAGATGSDGENVWNLGWSYTLWGKYDEALKAFDRYIRAYPDGDWKTNSLFWSAKIHDKLGRPAERDAKAAQLIAEYPHSYYAYRAKELWPASGAVAASATGSGSSSGALRSAGGAAAPQAFPDLDAELAKVEDARFATVRELQEIGLHRAAAREMKLVAANHATNPGVQFMLADVYLRGGEPFRANTVLQRNFRQIIRHGGTNVPQRFWQILYPLAYWETLQKEAQRRGLDPYLLASITRQESAFEPSTVSNAGAVGLMQIMPEEVARIASDAGLGPMTREDLFDPHKNIAVGAAEYSQKLAVWNGNHVLAIASYNAGQRAVGTWLEKTPIDDMDVFVESIPYAETRLYVKTVTRNRFEYRRFYDSSAAALRGTSTQ